MIRYFVVTLAALYTILMIFGDESRRPEQVTRVASDDVTGLSLADFRLPADKTEVVPLSNSGLSDAEAVTRAMDAGAALRRDRMQAPLRGEMFAAVAKPDSQASEAAQGEPSVKLWYVTGSRVNLRAGPGTGNDVVGQLTYGTGAEVLDDRGGWYQVRTPDGVMTGWISAKFLDERKPG